MKLRSIASAAALACVAAPSFALTPAQIDSSTVQLWISGATAPTAAVYGAIRKLCLDADESGAPDDLHVYIEGNPPAAADAVPGKSLAGRTAAYACTMGPLVPILDGVKTVVYHTFSGGSFEAYTPHLKLAGEVSPLVPTTLRRLNDIATTSSCTVIAGTPDPTYKNCGFSNVTIASNPNVYTVPTVPIGGVSDTEYVINQLNLAISKSLDDIGSEVPTNVGQAFGLAVSWPLYVTLQKSQGIISTTAADGEPCDPTYSGGSALSNLSAVNVTPACQPNVSRQKYSSLVSATGVTNKDASLFGAPAGSVIRVERRVGTSGTQSASNAFFLNTPCSSGLPGGGLTPAGSDTTGTVSFNSGKVLVRSNNGSGDVKANLNAATTNGEYAIGVLSMENVPSSSEKFSFVKLNGVSPNVDAKQRMTAIDGDYEFWYELVAFTANAATDEGRGLMTGLVTALGDPAITDLTGLFVTPLAGVTGSNVSKGYKTGNACSPAIQ